MKNLLTLSILLFNTMMAYSQDTLYWKDGNATLCELKKLNLRVNKVEAADIGEKTIYDIPLNKLAGAGGYGKHKELADAINSRIAELTIFPGKSRYKKGRRQRGSGGNGGP